MTDTEDQSQVEQNPAPIRMPEGPGPDTGAPALFTGEAERGIPSSRWQQIQGIINGQSSENMLGTPGFDPGYLNRYMAQKQQESWDQSQGTQKIPPDEANKRFPDMPVPFSAPIDPTVAAMQYNDFKHRELMQEYRDRGNPLPWGVEGALSMGAQVADPANLFLMGLAGPITEGLGMTSNLKNVFLTNLGLNVGTMGPGYFFKKAMNEPASAKSTGEDIVQGAIGGTVLHYGFQLLGKALGKGMDFIRRTPPDIQADIQRTTQMQHEAGTKIDTSQGVAETQSRLDAPTASDIPAPTRFNPAVPPSDLQYYMARDSHGTPVQFDELGRGTYLTDAKGVANASAVDPHAERQGLVGEYAPDKDSKFLDLEKTVEDPEANKFVESLEEKTGQKIAPDTGETLKEVLADLNSKGATTQMPVNILDQAQEVAKTLGYTGYRYVHVEPNGEPSHNGLFVFDDKLEPQKYYPADPTGIVPPSVDQRAAFSEESTSPRNLVDATPENERAMRDLSHERNKIVNPDHLDTAMKEQYEQTKAQLETQAKVDPEAAGDLKELKAFEALQAQEKGVLQDFADCDSDTSI